jgi:formamidopyrimidine-DNA glycosylase
MPELPEVETMCRGVAPAVGRRIVEVERPRCRLRPIEMFPRLPTLRKRLLGRRVDEVARIGKRVVLALDNESRLVIEPRMSGLVLLRDPPDWEHVRLVLHLSGDREILFWNLRGLGVVRLLSDNEFGRVLGPDRIGPDALTIGVDELRERLGGSDRSIKVALLDQRVAAGIGNLYASEILHRARIHPAAPCRRLTVQRWSKLHGAIGEVLGEAIEHQGSTLRDGTYRIARDEPGDFQRCHRVYQRASERCVQCGRAKIVRIVQAQRSTFFCPRCQRSPG